MKPIIFSTEMVRAILDGRKTQTRRVIKPQTVTHNGPDGQTTESIDEFMNRNWKDAKLLCAACAPYKPGQILWVRETWGVPIRVAGEIIYKADYTDKAPLADGEKWRSPIYMPREAARLFLLVKAVRVERLQEIAEADAIAEGAETDQYLEFLEWATSVAPGGSRIETVRDNFTHIWNRINARRGYGWDTNPWVWVIEFSRTEEPSCE